MNYTQIYDSLMKTRKNRVLNDHEYYERHHVVPISMNGPDVIDNIVILTAREHFLAHWLLWRIHRNRKMACAFMMMCRKSHSSRGYEEARKCLSETSMTRETKKKISDFAKTKIGEKNSFFGKKHSISQKNKWSTNRQGKISLKRKPVEQYSILDGKTIKVFSSMQDASIQLQIPIATINFSCNNSTKAVRKGRTFKFKYIE